MKNNRHLDTLESAHKRGRMLTVNTSDRKIGWLIVAATTVIVTLLSYFVIAPEYIASRYIGRVYRAVDTLRPEYLRLEESASNVLINDPDIEANRVTQEVEAMHALLRDNRINLVRFKNIVNEYTPLPYTGFTDRAKAAEVLHERANIFAGQSNEAFEQYDALVNFITQYETTAKSIDQYVVEFNAVSDLNVYAGRHEYISDIAQQIRLEIVSLNAAPAPHEAAAFKAASIESFQRLVDGFETVALGLQIPADDLIYEGARQIERVDQELSTHNQTIYTRDVLSSRTITSIQELREKLELISPSR